MKTQIVIDEIGFKLNRSTNEISLSGQTNRLKIIKANEYYQLNDRENGRNYNIVFDHSMGSGGVTVTVEAACDPKTE